MPTNSDIASLPRPEAGDPPNGPGAFVNLTNALDYITIPKFSSAAARDLKIPSPQDGQHAFLTDSHRMCEYNAGVGSWIILGASLPSIDSYDGVNRTTTSTTYTPLGTFGIVFTAPPSGAVQITFAGWIGYNAIAAEAGVYMSAEVRIGNTLGVGTQIVAAGDDRALHYQPNNPTSGYKYSSGSYTFPVSALTPGASYNTRPLHRIDTSGSTTAVTARRIIVTPLP